MRGRAAAVLVASLAAVAATGCGDRAADTAQPSLPSAAIEAVTPSAAPTTSARPVPSDAQPEHGLVGTVTAAVPAPTTEGRPPATGAPATVATTPAPPPVSTAAPEPGAAVWLLTPGSLAGVTVVLNPGHNGGNAAHPEIVNAQIDAGGFLKPCDTTGTETNDGYSEAAFTFDVAQRAAAMLREAGATVVLTRESNDGVGPCLDERARIANDAGAAAVVHIHADGAPADRNGFHVIRPALAPDGGNAGILDSSKRLATTLRAQFAAHTGQPFADYIGDQGMDVRSDLAGMNLSEIPSVFIECGNMRNAGDAAELADPAWRDQAAAGIANGIGEFVVGG